MISELNAVAVDQPLRKRVLLMVPSLMGGGAERVIITLANDFNAKGYAVSLVSINSESAAYPIQNGVKTVYLVQRSHDDIPHRIYYAMKVLLKLTFLLSEIKPICVISFITSANIFTGLASWATNTSYIVSERTSPNRSINKLGFLHKLLVANVYKRAKAVVVGSKAGQHCMLAIANFSKLANIHQIPNSVSKFDNINKMPVHSKRFILGVGRLSTVKGFDLLINAFAQIAVEDTDLLIVGEGEDRDELNKLIYNLGLGQRIFLVGKKLNLQDYYSQASLFVLPSRNEGYPNALIEAMSFGCSCIATDCEFGPAEIIINEHNGLLVKTESIPALTEAMIRVLNDTALRTKLSHHATGIKTTNDANTLFKTWENLVTQ